MGEYLRTLSYVREHCAFQTPVPCGGGGGARDCGFSGSGMF